LWLKLCMLYNCVVIASCLLPTMVACAISAFLLFQLINKYHQGHQNVWFYHPKSVSRTSASFRWIHGHHWCSVITAQICLSPSSHQCTASHMVTACQLIMTTTGCCCVGILIYIYL